MEASDNHVNEFGTKMAQIEDKLENDLRVWWGADAEVVQDCTKVLNPDENMRSYSASLNADHERSMLNSDRAWTLPYGDETDEWLLIDAG
jgi:hypothetical protein